MMSHSLERLCSPPILIHPPQPLYPPHSCQSALPPQYSCSLWVPFSGESNRLSVVYNGKIKVKTPVEKCHFLLYIHCACISFQNMHIERSSMVSFYHLNTFLELYDNIKSDWAHKVPFPPNLKLSPPILTSPPISAKNFDPRQPFDF